MRMPLEQKAKILFGEAFARKHYLAGTFLATVAVFMVAGLFWPRSYVSSATIVVDDHAIMTPLARNESRQTGVMDQAKIAQNLVRSRPIVRRAMVYAGWLHGHTTAETRQRLIAKVRKHITVTDAGKNLIRISYRDTNPLRAHLMTERLVQLFLVQTNEMAARESGAAYRFINTEVHHYRKKLAGEGQQLSSVRANIFEATGTARAAAARRLLHLESQRDAATVELQEAHGRRAALRAQLGDQIPVDAQMGRTDALQKQLAMDRQALAKLQLSYQNQYPGIVILKARIAALKKHIDSVKGGVSGPVPGAPVFASQIEADRFYQGLQQELAATNTNIAVLKAKIQEAGTLINSDRQASGTVYRGRTVSQLMRNYDIDAKTLRGLLTRRESARLAMSMGNAQNNVSFHVADPANLPLNPAGPSFGIFALVGLLAGLTVPFALLHLKAQFDERVRFSGVISEKLNLPVVATIPHVATPVEATQSRRNMQWLGVLVASMVLIVVSILLSGSIL
ncbi:MAG: hypothetical protein ACYCP0_02170 [Acidiferrobacteraceae bacterium]